MKTWNRFLESLSRGELEKQSRRCVDDSGRYESLTETHFKFLYHGTHNDPNDIIKQGITPHGGGVYLTTDFEEASDWAETALIVLDRSKLRGLGLRHPGRPGFRSDSDEVSYVTTQPIPSSAIVAILPRKGHKLEGAEKYRQIVE